MTEAFSDVYADRDAWLRRRERDGSDVYAAAIAHARSSVPFYADGDLPLVGRADHQRDPAAFRAGDDHPYTLSSSGTTGSPLTVAVDRAAWYAVNYHFFAQINDLAGGVATPAPPGRIAIVFVSNKPGRSGFVRPMPSLCDSLYVRLQLDALAANPVGAFTRVAAPVLYGKPTYLLDLRTALIRAGAERSPWSPRILLTSGEKLHPDDERRLTEYFGAPVLDAYASTEGGLIAARPPGSSGYRVIADNVRLEVLRADGSVADSGTGELIVTNLVNRATALIRYRTDDRGTLVTAADGTQILTELLGRELDTLPGGVATARITTALADLDGFGDFQIAVTGTGVIARFAPDVTCTDVETLTKAFHDEVTRVLNRSDITVERLDRITPPGGKKRRYLISQE